MTDEVPSVDGPADVPSRRLLLVAGITAAAVAIAWVLRWGTDDAFTSFVYARSLVEGHGVTWFGAHVEGYQSFLWVLWSALGLEAGADPLVWAWGASLVALAATIIITYRIAVVRSTALAGLAAIAVLATNVTFLAFGTSGLETMLQTALLAAVWFEVEKLRRQPPNLEQTIVIGTYASLALWTRLDSAPALAVLALVAAQRLAKTQVSVRTWVGGAMPVLVLVGGWFLWKLSFYETILPHTFRVTSSGVMQFLSAYMLWPLLAGIAVLAIVRRRVASALPLALVAAHVAYVIAVGGDVLEFRSLVPILPPLAIALGEFATTDAPRLPVQLRVAALIVFVAAGSLHHGMTFDKLRGNDWAKLGNSLSPLRDTSATIACTDAGAIPYYARLPSVDQRGATYEHLKSRAVTFVIGSPMLVARGGLAARTPELDRWLRGLVAWQSPPNGTYDVVAAPVDNQVELVMWYLTPDPDVSARIATWDHVRLHVP